MGEFGKPRSGNKIARIFAERSCLFKRNKIVKKIGVVFSAEDYFTVFKKGKIVFFREKAESFAFF